MNFNIGDKIMFKPDLFSLYVLTTHGVICRVISNEEFIVDGNTVSNFIDVEIIGIDDDYKKPDININYDLIIQEINCAIPMKYSVNSNHFIPYVPKVSHRDLLRFDFINADKYAS